MSKGKLDLFGGWLCVCGYFVVLGKTCPDCGGHKSETEVH